MISIEKGATVTFLLRSPNVFDTDTTIQRYIQSGHARLVQGDALKVEDVANGWEKALEVPSCHVDLVLFVSVAQCPDRDYKRPYGRFG